MLLKTFIPCCVLAVLVMGCASERTVIIEKNEEDVKKKYNATIYKLFRGKALGVQNAYGLESIIMGIDENSSNLNIYSQSKDLNNVITRSVLQEYYLEQGGVIPLDNTYSRIGIRNFSLLTVLNAGLGLGYMVHEDILSTNRTMEYACAGLYGLLDLGATAGFVYGIAAPDTGWVFLGLANMLLLKAIPFLAIPEIRIHNSIIDSGYNFSDKFNEELKTELRVKYKFD